MPLIMRGKTKEDQDNIKDCLIKFRFLYVDSELKIRCIDNSEIIADCELSANNREDMQLLACTIEKLL